MQKHGCRFDPGLFLAQHADARVYAGDQEFAHVVVQAAGDEMSALKFQRFPSPVHDFKEPAACLRAPRPELAKVEFVKNPKAKDPREGDFGCRIRGADVDGQFIECGQDRNDLTSGSGCQGPAKTFTTGTKEAGLVIE
ncbi:MAG: hypothetical protein EOP81_17960 [Variovorax sp.]|nr:MAG: hypothetical protein EOP81_17960 [Variovorax sp.]